MSEEDCSVSLFRECSEILGPVQKAGRQEYTFNVIHF